MHDGKEIRLTSRFSVAIACLLMAADVIGIAVLLWITVARPFEH